ncbi:MAG TPA: PilZ domain-containing protein [Candidatus Dormibacteraeota bacterium]|nr:PilZ domain-containing protein [Candidatus Dormibacteraeota bacterium]
MAQRFSLAIPLFIREWNSLAPGKTAESLNISESGVYFEMNAPPRKGAMVEIRIRMPEIITGAATVEWRCVGKVMGVQPANSLHEAMGVRVRFDYYEVMGIHAPAPKPSLSG